MKQGIILARELNEESKVKHPQLVPHCAQWHHMMSIFNYLSVYFYLYFYIFYLNIFLLQTIKKKFLKKNALPLEHICFGDKIEKAIV